MRENELNDLGFTAQHEVTLAARQKLHCIKLSVALKGVVLLGVMAGCKMDGIEVKQPMTSFPD